MRNTCHVVVALALAIGIQAFDIPMASAEESRSSDPQAEKLSQPPPILVPPYPTAPLPPTEGIGKRQAAAPLTSPASWIKESDYPAIAVRNDLEGTTGVTVIVGRDGKVQSCNVAISSGIPVLDATTCALIEERALFRPALDYDGKPTEGSYSTRVVWRSPPPEAFSEDGHPLFLFEEGDVSFSFIVGVDGSVSDFRIIENRGPFSDENPCPPTDARVRPILDGQGIPVRKRVTNKLSVEIGDPGA
jgi:TonB family protein